MIYLDNAATTKPCKAASDAMLSVVDEFGNETRVLNTCHHTLEFMTQEGIEGIILSEQAAAVAAAQAAQGTTAEAQPQDDSTGEAVVTQPAEETPAPAEVPEEN